MQSGVKHTSSKSVTYNVDSIKTFYDYNRNFEKVLQSTAKFKHNRAVVREQNQKTTV